MKKLLIKSKHAQKELKALKVVAHARDEVVERRKGEGDGDAASSAAGGDNERYMRVVTLSISAHNIKKLLTYNIFGSSW